MSRYVYIAVIFGTLIIFVSANRQADTQAVKSEADVVHSDVGTRTATFGAVDAEITPTQLEKGQNVIFSASFNTHSVDLGYKWGNVVSLKDDRGNNYEFEAWTGENEGHHVKGDFVFTELQSGAGELTLVLNGIDGATKSMVWKI